VIAGQGLPADGIPEATTGDPKGAPGETAWAKYNRLLATNPQAAGQFYAESADKIYASRHV
jgi:hypothetical protein